MAAEPLDALVDASLNRSETSALAAAREVLHRLEEERDLILRDIEFQKQMIAELAAQDHLEARRMREPTR